MKAISAYVFKFFKGENCTLKNCDLLNCQNNAECYFSTNSRKYECNCTESFTGDLCEFNIEQMNETYFYSAVCDPTVDFNRCNEKFYEIQQRQLRAQQQQQARIPKEFVYHVVMWPLAGIIVGLIIVILSVFVHKVRKSRSTHGTYSPSRHEQHSSRIEFNMNLKRPPEERLI